MEARDFDLKNHCSQRLFTVAPSATMADAAALMSRHQLSQILVTHHDRVLGMLGEVELKKAYQVSIHRWNDLRVHHVKLHPEHLVSDYMTSVTLVDHATPLAMVIDKMLQKRLCAVALTEDDKPIALFRTEDALRILQKLLRPEEGLIDKMLAPAFATSFHNTLGNLATELSNSGI